jgi:hypothetical protein
MRIRRTRHTRRTDVFVRDDFADFGAYDVVGRELRNSQVKVCSLRWATACTRERNGRSFQAVISRAYAAVGHAPTCRTFACSRSGSTSLMK